MPVKKYTKPKIQFLKPTVLIQRAFSKGFIVKENFASYSPESIKCNRLFLRLSKTFQNAPPARVGKAITAGLQALSETLGADKGVLSEFLQDSNIFQPTHSWYPKEDAAEMRKHHAWEEDHWDELVESRAYLTDRWLRGEFLVFHELEALPVAADKLKRLYRRYGIKSGVSAPVFINNQVVGGIGVYATRRFCCWPDDLVPCLSAIGELFAGALARKRLERLRKDAFERLMRNNRQMALDFQYLHREMRREIHDKMLVGKSTSFRDVLEIVERVAPTDTTVLILGETGTGKELIAQALHQASRRQARPLVQINCAALPAGLIEAELFGHEKGAFTGAVSRKAGRFSVANGATLFLDEIGELPLALQPKLLRALQAGEFEPLGGGNTVKTDVRIIAATNRDLEKEVKAGRFREDLWYRLNVFPVTLPRLRDRRADIPFLIQRFAEKIGKKIGQPIVSIPDETVASCMAYDWPGNIRELENLVERAVIISRDGCLRMDLPGGAPTTSVVESKKLGDVEKAHILRVLDETNWVIQGHRGAANILGLTPSTLRYRMKRLGISRS